MSDSGAGRVTQSELGEMDELGELRRVAERVAASAPRAGEEGFAARAAFRARGRAALLGAIGSESPYSRRRSEGDGSFASLRMTEGRPQLTEEELTLTARGLGLEGGPLGRAERHGSRAWILGRLNRRVAVMALVATLPFVIGGCAVAASQEAVPGDALYQIKLGRDGLEITMARGEPARAEAYGRVAERRLLDAQRAEVLGRSRAAEEALAQSIETKVRAEELRAKALPARPVAPIAPVPPGQPAPPVKPNVPDPTAIKAQAEAEALARVAPLLERAMLFRETASALGMAPAELGRAARRGESLSEIAQARGMDEDGLVQLVRTRVQGRTVAGRPVQVAGFGTLEAAMRLESINLSVTRSNDSWWDRLGEKLERVFENVFGRVFDRVSDRLEERLRL